jgi:GNAT superfamily N-acetyltransferase
VRDLTIEPLATANWPALADLFSAGGDPKWCWCMWWRSPGATWTNASADRNRAALRELVGREPAPGLVAIRDGRAVGWVGLAPRAEYARLARSRTIPRLPGDDVWAITCFVVAREARRSGVAGALLEAAVEYARVHGARTLEGYPVRTDGSRMPSASAYTGTLGMFERAGFTVVSETTSRAGGGRPRVVVRLEAAGAGDDAPAKPGERPGR